MNNSTFTTIDDTDELSICYNNLYIINDRFCYLTTDKIELPLVNTWTDTYGWKPEIIFFKTQNELDQYLNNYPVIEINDAIYGGIMWSGNIGHALLDGLYPLYLALVKFNKQNVDFTFITNYWDDPYPNMAIEVIEKFSRNKIIELNKLNNSVHRIKSLISGTGRTGNRVMREDYTLYGKKYNGMGYFRERMRKTYNINPDISINSTSPNIIFIDNKRYSPLEINEINKVIDYYKNLGFNIEYLFWNKYKTFSEQMKRFEDVDIQISGPGTGMNYSPFLKRGAVSINLGCIKNIKNDINLPSFPAYMEQSVGAGQDNISTIFYDRLKYKDLYFNSMIEIIDKAIMMIKDSIILSDNHYIDAKIFIEYCKRAKNSRSLCVYLTNIAHFIEYFVNGDPNTMLDGVVDVQLLEQIKKEFNYK